MMVTCVWPRTIVVCVFFTLVVLPGCNQPAGSGNTNPSHSANTSTSAASADAKRKATADAKDVAAARARIASFGSRSKVAPKEGDLLVEIVIQDGSNVTADDVELFGKLSDLDKLQIFNCRVLNDEMAAKLEGLKGLTSLALTNSGITDVAVEMIAKSFPNLVELDLSSNTNMTNAVIKILSAHDKLQQLTLVQNRVNDIGAQRLSKLRELRSLDLRGNMEAGDMALDVVSELPKLTSFKHRSTAVTDTGMDYLGRSQTLESLLLQDFVITDQSGPSIAKLGKLSHLELFRCQGFGTEGVLALKGMGLTRLTLRDLPNVDDRAMEVFDDLPKLKRLYLHELPSVGDSGLKHLSALSALERLDIWTVPQMSDGTIEAIAALPALKELSVRSTGVTDACIDALLKVPHLQSLTFKENGSVTAEGLKKLATKKWAKLDTGASGSSDASDAGAP